MSRRAKKVNKYRSGFEAKVAAQLEAKKIKYEYESVKLAYLVPESKHKYTPDFKLPNGILIEVKGKWDSDGRKKMALVMEQNPTEDIRMLFMRDQPIRKGSNTYYSDVCEKLGIEYAFKEVPEEWLE